MAQEEDPSMARQATAASMEAERVRRRSAPAASTTGPSAATSARRSTVVGTYDDRPRQSVEEPRPVEASACSTPSSGDTAAAAPSRRDTEPSLRKRAERLHGLETMFSMDQIFSRDLRITGVSKKGASWRYHIEVLDIRGSLIPFTESFTSTSTSPASSSIASLSSLPPASAAFTLPPVVRYSVMRRYNDFRQLFLYLADTYEPEVMDALPKFPDGGLLSYFRGDDPKLLQFRKEQLQRFLRALDENEDTKWSRAFRLFLNPEIDELSAIGGVSFAAMVEHAASGHAPVSSSSSSTYWTGVGLARINTNSGYVSLSHVKSPEIRFKKQPSDGRGDWKRRKIANRGGDDLGDGEQHVKRPRRVKRLDLEPEQDNQSATGDEEEEEEEGEEDDDDDDEDEDDEVPKKLSTELMKLLSLEPPVERQ